MDDNILNFDNAIYQQFYITMKEDNKYNERVHMTRRKQTVIDSRLQNIIIKIIGLAFLISSVESCVVISSSSTSALCTICTSTNNFTCVYTSPKGLTQQLDSASCVAICCDGNIFQNTSKYDKCNSNDNNSSGADVQGNLSLATILIIVFFSIPAGICIFIAIVSCISNHRRRRETVDNENPPLSGIDLKEYNIDDLGPLYQDKSQSCSICLEIECNLRTKCGHAYHSQCLLAWIHKKQKCPLCVTREYNPIVLYCTMCFKQAKMALLIDQMQINEVQQWEKYCQIKCETCLNRDSEDEISLNIDDHLSNQKNNKRGNQQKHKQQENKESLAKIIRND